MSYQVIETALVGGMVVGAVLYASSRWWPASLQPIKRWRKTPAGGCGSGCGGCSSGGGCSTPASPVSHAQVVVPPRSHRAATATTQAGTSRAKLAGPASLTQEHTP